jgi:hypothetical protein
MQIVCAAVCLYGFKRFLKSTELFGDRNTGDTGQFEIFFEVVVVDLPCNEHAVGGGHRHAGERAQLVLADAVEDAPVVGLETGAMPTAFV